MQDLIKQLDSKVRSNLCIAFWDVEAALLASDRLSNTIVAIDDDGAERMYSPTLLLVGVPTGQVKVAWQLLVRTVLKCTQTAKLTEKCSQNQGSDRVSDTDLSHQPFWCSGRESRSSCELERHFPGPFEFGHKQPIVQFP